MRLLYLIIALAIIAAVVAPFYLRDPSGVPLMTVDKFVDDNTPDALATSTTVYRWQDAEGIWQYGDSPPDIDQAQVVEIRPNLSPIKADWVSQVEAREAELAASQPVNEPVASDAPAGMPGLGDVYGGQAIEQAKAAAALVDQHHLQLEQVMQRTKRK